MMTQRLILLFGYSDYAREIAWHMRESKKPLKLFALDESSVKEGLKDGFDISLFDMHQEVAKLGSEEMLSNAIVFCALDSDENNIFLTLTIRAANDEVEIIALANSMHNISKLTSAGANRVIPKLATAIGHMRAILEKPKTLRVFLEKIYSPGELNISQVTIQKGSIVENKTFQEIDIHNKFRIVILAVVDHQFETHFMFTTNGIEHTLVHGDVLIIMGFDNDIEAFEQEIGVVQ